MRDATNVTQEDYAVYQSRSGGERVAFLQERSALVVWRAAAEAGAADGCFLLGKCLGEGIVVEADLEQAREWYRRGAEQGHVDCQVNLANELLKQKEHESGCGWMLRAGEAGSITAMCNLAHSALTPRRTRAWWRETHGVNGVFSTEMRYAVAHEWASRAVAAAAKLGTSRGHELREHAETLCQDIERRARELKLVLDPEERALKVLLCHDDPDRRRQGVQLLHSLGAAAAGSLLQPPYLSGHRPVVSVLDSYLLSPQLLHAWAGPQTPWPWCRGLTELNLAGQFHLTDLSPVAGLITLERLSLQGCIRLTDLSALASLTALTWLRLAACRTLTDLSPVAHCADLESLDLASCDALVTLSSLAALPRLHTLSLRDCHQVTDLSPLSGHPGLVSLDLRQSGVKVYAPLLSCPALKTVTVGSVYGEQKAALAPLQAHCEVIL